MEAGAILLIFLVCVTAPSVARTAQDEINERCRDEVGDETSKTYRECVEREEQRFEEMLSNALIRKNRDELEKSLGTAREVAKRCSDFELKTESMTTMYCLPLFRRAISIAVATTGCQGRRYLDTFFLIREELRSIWFFDTRTFLVVVEDVLKDNFNCFPKE